MEFDFNTQLTRSDELIEADIDNDKVMMHIESGQYFGLDAVANRIWQLLETPQTAEALIEQLTQEYDISTEQCRTDMEPFLQDMIKHQILFTE